MLNKGFSHISPPKMSNFKESSNSQDLPITPINIESSPCGYILLDCSQIFYFNCCTLFSIHRLADMNIYLSPCVIHSSFFTAMMMRLQLPRMACQYGGEPHATILNYRISELPHSEYLVCKLGCQYVGLRRTLSCLELSY